MAVNTHRRHEHGHGEEVLDEPQRPTPADEGDEEVPVEQVPVGLEDGEHKDGEAPEGEGVRHARDRPAQELALAADLEELGPDPGPDLGEALGVGAALADEAEEVGEAVAGDGQGDRVAPKPRAILIGDVLS